MESAASKRKQNKLDNHHHPDEAPNEQPVEERKRKRQRHSDHAPPEGEQKRQLATNGGADDRLKQQGHQLLDTIGQEVVDDRLISGAFQKIPSKRQYPDYHKQIKQPISLDIITTRLDNNTYADFRALTDDLLMLVHNAYAYNEEGSVIFDDARRIEEMVERKLRAYEAVQGDRELQQAIVDSLLGLEKDGRQCAQIFLELPSKKDYPDYYRVIKRPISFAQVEKNLRTDGYAGWEEFERDLATMWTNAEEFNEEASVVVQDARFLQSQTEKLVQKKKPRNPLKLVLKNTTGKRDQHTTKIKLNLGSGRVDGVMKQDPEKVQEPATPEVPQEAAPKHAGPEPAKVNGLREIAPREERYEEVRESTAREEVHDATHRTPDSQGKLHPKYNTKTGRPVGRPRKVPLPDDPRYPQYLAEQAARREAIAAGRYVSPERTISIAVRQHEYPNTNFQSLQSYPRYDATAPISYAQPQPLVAQPYTGAPPTPKPPENVYRTDGQSVEDALLAGVSIFTPDEIEPSFSLDFPASPKFIVQSFAFSLPATHSTLYVSPSIASLLAARPYSLSLAANGRRLNPTHNYNSRRSVESPKASFEVKLTPGLNLVECQVTVQSKDGEEGFDKEKMVLWILLRR